MSDKPTTLAEEMDKLREAWLDLCYALLKPLVGIVERIPGLRPKPWVRERQIREQWRRDGD